jgi:hypothetical protein
MTRASRACSCRRARAFPPSVLLVPLGSALELLVRSACVRVNPRLVLRPKRTRIQADRRTETDQNRNRPHQTQLQHHTTPHHPPSRRHVSRSAEGCGRRRHGRSVSHHTACLVLPLAAAPSGSARRSDERVAARARGTNARHAERGGEERPGSITCVVQAPLATPASPRLTSPQLADETRSTAPASEGRQQAAAGRQQ